jgi:predicted NBD/HSP70 family sugar kinase
MKAALNTLEPARIEVLLASDSFEINTELLPKRCGFAYLVDAQDVMTFRDQRAICKFQKADLFYKQILMVYSENAERMGFRTAGDGSRIILFTGVGGGVVIDGKIYSGSNYAGAELGHVVMIMDGEPCTCGRRGCWETYSSATALHRQTKAAMEANPDSLMWKLVDGDITKVDGRIPFEAMKQGDAAGKAVVDRYCEYLACGLLNVINVFQPDVLAVGGGVCRQGEYLLGPVRKLIEEGRYSKYSTKQTKLCVAELGNDAGIVGAACLGRNA